MCYEPRHAGWNKSRPSTACFLRTWYVMQPTLLTNARTLVSHSIMNFCDSWPRICLWRSENLLSTGRMRPSFTQWRNTLSANCLPLLNYSKIPLVHRKDSYNLENLWRQYALVITKSIITGTIYRYNAPYPHAQSETLESGLKSQSNFLGVQVSARMRYSRTWRLVVRKPELWTIDQVCI